MIPLKLILEPRFFPSTMASSDWSGLAQLSIHELTSEVAFDNGHLKKNPDEAQKLIEGLVSIMSEEQYEPEHTLLIAFQSIWLRVSHASVLSLAWFLVQR